MVLTTLRQIGDPSALVKKSEDLSDESSSLLELEVEECGVGEFLRETCDASIGLVLNEL